MFTGLVQETGQIAAIRRLAARSGRTGVAALTRITIATGTIACELKTGDSVSVSGVCLTAVELRGKQFSADLAQETLQRTSLGRLQKGSLVNLELPALAQDRLGGHIVQGHVDGTGKLQSLEKIKDREDWRLVIEVPQAITKYIVAQGSIAVEGISLTVAAIHDDRLESAVIPHTYQATNLRALRPGDEVNLEVDILAKYAEKIAQGSTTGRLTVAELIKQGF
jgi:riboflavin synthase